MTAGAAALREDLVRSAALLRCLGHVPNGPSMQSTPEQEAWVQHGSASTWHTGDSWDAGPVLRGHALPRHGLFFRAKQGCASEDKVPGLHNLRAIDQLFGHFEAIFREVVEELALECLLAGPGDCQDGGDVLCMLQCNVSAVPCSCSSSACCRSSCRPVLPMRVRSSLLSGYADCLMGGVFGNIITYSVLNAEGIGFDAASRDPWRCVPGL